MEKPYPKFARLALASYFDNLVFWHPPQAQVKGIFFYAGGCGEHAGEMFMPEGPDGWSFAACEDPAAFCEGNADLLELRQDARQRGYLVVSVQGGRGNPRGCFNTNDVPAVEQALQHVRRVEGVPDVPVIV